MAAWIDDRDYERKSTASWLLPVGVLGVLFLAGVILLRPQQTADQSNFGGQAGVGGGPPTSGVSPTLTPASVMQVTPTPTVTPSPTPTRGVIVMPSY